MRPRSPWAVGLFLSGVILFAIAAHASARSLTVEDVLRLHSAGVADDVILSEIIVTETVFQLDVDDILRLHEAGVSERVVQFMIDTGRDVPEGDATESAGDGDDADAEEEDDDGDGEYWVSDGYDSRVFVSLRYGYPAWWYDVYWWDYWYYDCHYRPWYVSWSYPFGAWYPTWYYPTSCWVSPGFGYRCDWWSSPHRVHWNAFGRDGYCFAPTSGFSSWKYKAGGGSSSGALIASGLKTRDGSRFDVARRTRGTKLAIDDLGDDVRRIDSGVRRPATPGREVRHPDLRKPDVRRPARPIRKPASVDRPVRKIVRTPSRGGEVEVRKPARASRERVQNGRAPERETKATTPQVKSAPPKQKSAPQVERGGGRSAPRASPPPRGQSGRGNSGGHARGGKGR